MFEFDYQPNFMKRIFLFVVLLFSSLFVAGQTNKVVEWMNQNAIKIEDAYPDSKLSTFDEKIPEKFLNAQIFGFGEASHHGKEFFDLKTKFFKYLVEHQDVKVFIIEDSYPSESGINEWITGGKGNAETIAQNFSIIPWYCKEVVDLLQWMRRYNHNKSEKDQIRFYGMDIQNAQNINTTIRTLVTNYNIQVSEELLLVADACAEKKVEYGKSTTWGDIQIPKLNTIKSILINAKKSNNAENDRDFDSTIRALDYLIKYTFYVQHNHSQYRDLKMFENVKWIVENKSHNGKAFIWAHNEHINNQGFGNFSKRNIYNLGRHLKEQYKNKYYSVGFDFGKGTLGGYVFNKKRGTNWKSYELTKPYPKTYAHTLSEVNEDIYFVDMDAALKSEASKFFSKKHLQLVLGASGYNPEKNQLFTKKYSEMYDGLIFVESISIPTYQLTNK